MQAIVLKALGSVNEIPCIQMLSLQKYLRRRYVHHMAVKELKLPLGICMTEDQKHYSSQCCLHPLVLSQCFVSHFAAVPAKRSMQRWGLDEGLRQGQQQADFDDWCPLNGP